MSDTFIEKINKIECKTRIIRKLETVIFDEHSRLPKNLTDSKVLYLIELSYGSAWRKNQNELDFSSDEYENTISLLVDDSLDIFEGFIISYISKREL